MCLRVDTEENNKITQVFYTSSSGAVNNRWINKNVSGYICLPHLIPSQHLVT